MNDLIEILPDLHPALQAKALEIIEAMAEHKRRIVPTNPRTTGGYSDQ